jgi:lysophospholipase L1-like esterase
VNLSDVGGAQTPTESQADGPDGEAPLDADAAAQRDATRDASTPPYKPCPPTGTPCVIMALGDSITNGYNSTTGGGYRVELLTRLWASHYDATLVGDNKGGPATLDGQPFPQGNEGFDGYTIDDAPAINRKGIAPLVPAALAKYSPNIVLLMIGTNDVGTVSDLPNLPTRLANLMDVITSDSPAALLLVAQILPLGGPSDTKDNGNAQAYNAAISGLVRSRIDAGKHIDVTDMYSAMTANPSYATQRVRGVRRRSSFSLRIHSFPR